jgi:hypothetical protein
MHREAHDCRLGLACRLASARLGVVCERSEFGRNELAQQGGRDASANDSRQDVPLV